MAAQRLGAPGEDDAGLAAIGDRDEHRGGMRDRLGIEIVMVAGEQDRLVRGRQRGAKAIGERHRGSSAKQAPLLHTPGGLLPLASAIWASS